LQKKAVDLQSVVDDTLTLVAHDLRQRQISVSVELPANSRVIEGDPVLLEQVFVNLVMNAMDAMAAIPPERRQLKISSATSENNVEVSVRDSGPGLPADLIGRLFTPFVTTKSHGIGIGLSITRTIVEAHGGRIACHNNPDGGATFTVTLPSGDVQAVRAA